MTATAGRTAGRPGDGSPWLPHRLAGNRHDASLRAAGRLHSGTLMPPRRVGGGRSLRRRIGNGERPSASAAFASRRLKGKFPFLRQGTGIAVKPPGCPRTRLQGLAGKVGRKGFDAARSGAGRPMPVPSAVAGCRECNHSAASSGSQPPPAYASSFHRSAALPRHRLPTPPPQAAVAPRLQRLPVSFRLPRFRLLIGLGLLARRSRPRPMRRRNRGRRKLTGNR